MNTSDLHILCVDDDDDTCDLIRLMLEGAHAACQVTSAKTGAEALALIASKKFDLYVLDYRYPDMAGVEICQRIRERHAQTPILFFTGAAREVERREAMNSGANAYLIKPNDLGKLAETARQLLSAESS